MGISYWSRIPDNTMFPVTGERGCSGLLVLSPQRMHVLSNSDSKAAAQTTCPVHLPCLSSTLAPLIPLLSAHALVSLDPPLGAPLCPFLTPPPLAPLLSIGDDVSALEDFQMTQ